MTPSPIVPTPPATTLSYEQSAALMQDFTFQGRVKVACLAYAQTITLEPTGSTAHNTRMRWAQSVYQNPMQVAQQITPPVVLNPNVQQNGSDITDDNLQGVVQVVVDNLM